MKSAFLPFDERLALIADVIKPAYAELRSEGRVAALTRFSCRNEPGAGVRPSAGCMRVDVVSLGLASAGHASGSRHRAASPVMTPEHLLRRRRLRPADRRLLPGRRRLPAGAAPARAHHRGERRRRRRRPGGRAQHPRARRAARLARQPAGARDLALPDPRPAAQPRPLHLRRAGARAGSSRSPTPTCRPTPYGPYQVRAGRVARRGAAPRAHGCALPALADALHRLPRLGRRGHPGVPDRRLQQPVVPRLDAGRRRRPAGRAVRRPLAGQQGAGRRRLPRLLPRRAPRPGRRPGLHLDARRPGDASRTTSSTGSTGCCTRGRPHAVSSRLVGERGNPQVDLAFTPGRTPPTTAASSPPSTSTPAAGAAERRRPQHRRVIIGDRQPLARPVPRHGRRGRGRSVVRPPGADGRPLVAPCRPAVAPTAAVSAAHGRAVRRALRPGPRDHHGRTDRGPSHRSGSTAAAPAPAMTTSGRRTASATDRRVAGPGARQQPRLDRPVPVPSDLRRSRSYLIYRYTRTAIEGSLTFATPTRTSARARRRWPLPPGQYVARLLVDDSYRVVALDAAVHGAPRPIP